MRTRDGRNFVLEEDLTFIRPAEVGGAAIRVPAGSTTDGASIPEPLWSAGFPPFGPWWMAAVLHDAAYHRQTVPEIPNRQTADLVFWEAMVALGVEASIARTIYAGVRAGGQHAWDENRVATP